MFRQGELPKLDLQVDCGMEFAAWSIQWESYSSLSELSKEDLDQATKVKTLMFFY